MFYVGIDWADLKHDICVVDERGERVAKFTIPHTAQGLNKLHRRLSMLTPNRDEILVALETDKGLVVSFLLDLGYTIYPINPKVVSRYRDRYRTSGAKSDPLDALVLANILRTDRHRFRPIMPDSTLARELKVLTRDHKHLVKSRTALSNQLTACLKAYYPRALELFSKVTQPITLAFLKAYPTPQSASGLSLKGLKCFLSEHRYTRPERVEELYNALQQPQMAAESWLVRAKSRHMLALVGQLEPLLSEIKSYEKEIKKLLKKHPDSEIFRSLPGAGLILAARMLAEIGDNRKRYSDYQALQCEAGTAPVTIASGNYSYVRFRRACKKSLRAALHQFAFCSRRESDWANQFYHQQRSKGKSNSLATRALANKWVKVIFALWQKRQTYNESFHLWDKARYTLKARAA